MHVRACAVVDSDLRSIAPSWIDRLVSPTLRLGYEFVAPVYLRHRFDGTITNSIAYPLTRALYGLRIRQPIGGEFGFHTDLARAYLAQPVWDTDVARFGIDIFMTTTAVARHARVVQAFEPATFDHVDRPPASAPEEPFRVRIGRAWPRPKGASRAIARVPEKRKVPRVDRPDQKLVGRRRLCPMRREARDRGVLADMPERMRSLAAIRRRRRARHHP